LLTFLVFNWVGYWLFISWFEGRESVRMEMRLDREEYDRGQLILFKVPASSIPYATASAGFERADGELEVGNIHYRYVLKRLFNDSMEFLCVADSEAGRLSQAKSEIIHLATDLPGAGGHGKSSSGGKISIPGMTVFYQPAPSFCIRRLPASVSKADLVPASKLSAGHTRCGWQPPRTA
jgi:hypothetical protein